MIVHRPMPPRVVAAAALLALLVPAASRSLHAQRPDSARAGVATPRPRLADSLLAPPLSPRAAFLHSLLLPGWAQHRLHRTKSTILFGTVEAAALFMNVKTRLRLSDLERHARDSIVVPVPPSTVADTIHLDDGVIRSRKQQVEDWTTLLIFNHLFAGADAFVAAHLWDVPAQVGFRPAPGGGIAVVARIRW
ncbi:MAG: hypothetical protein M3081_09620 [Gemmatimonadota bacterium]|nr:hypothetical protein [Gemmatimonadota bacterium]